MMSRAGRATNMPSEYEDEVWQVRERTAVYQSEWVELWLEEVEIPGLPPLIHHVLRFPRQSVYAVVVRDGNILLLWRHRFITGDWGWEVPAGWVDANEDALAAVRREVEEETGWRAGRVERVAEYNAQSGMSNMRFTLFCAYDPEYVGERTDRSESSKLAWVPIDRIRSIIRAGEIKDGPSILAITYYLSLIADQAQGT
jgi:8-oxo-dGDP phosphatase